VVLVSISLMISDVERLFMRLLVICMSSLEKMSIQILFHFLIRLGLFLLLNEFIYFFLIILVELGFSVS